ALKLQKDRVFVDDVEERAIRKALLVIANRGRRVDTRQDGRLTRCALRPSLDTESRVGFNQDTIKRNLGLLILKIRQRRRIGHSIQWIVWTARSDAKAVYEKEQDSCHCSIS